jgi:predicted MFS family arabinose efflux permease
MCVELHMSQITLSGRLNAFFGLSLQIVIVIFLSRLTIDVGNRLISPFIPQFAAGLGLTIVSFSWLMFIRSLTGLTGPLSGIMADKFGRRRLMAVGLFSQAIGVWGLAFSTGWWAVIPAIFLGICFSAYAPAQQAYVSDQVAYARRGRVMAAIEFSWALVGIVALPIVGWMIDTYGWRAPLLVLGLLSITSGLLVWFTLPKIDHVSRQQLDLAQLRRVFLKPGVLASVMVATLVFFGVMIFSTIWSIWLTADFGLTATTLGLVATTIGISELGGSVTSSIFIDRLGKRRGSILGLCFTSLAFVLLPFTQGSFPLAVGGLFLLGVGSEFSVVSLLPLYSEQAPEARATTFALVGVGVAIGVAWGAPATALLWEHVGLWAVSATAITGLLLAAGLVWRFLHESN